MFGGRDGADNVDDGGCKIIGVRDMIHLGRLKRSQRHLVRGGVQGMLHDRGAAAGLDRVQTGGAIVEHPREHQPHGARAKGQGHGPEHRVDGRAGHVLARAHTQADRVANHQKMSVGRCHIDMAGFDRLSVDGGRDRQCAPAAEGRGENTGRMGRDMGRDEDACRKVGRQVLQDRLKHLSASGRTTDGNDVLVLLVHRSPASVGSLCALGGHIHPGQPPCPGSFRPGRVRIGPPGCPGGPSGCGAAARARRSPAPAGRAPPGNPAPPGLGRAPGSSGPAAARQAGAATARPRANRG